MSSARQFSAWSFAGRPGTPATYAPPQVQSGILHETWNATKAHWTVMQGAQILCDCGRRDDRCRRCRHG